MQPYPCTRGSAWTDPVSSLAARGTRMEISDKQKIGNIQIKAEDTQGTSAAYVHAAPTTDAARSLDSRSTVPISGQSNNAAVLFKENTSREYLSKGQRKRRRKRMMKELNLAVNPSAPSTASQATANARSGGVKRPRCSIDNSAPNGGFTKKRKVSDERTHDDDSLDIAVVSMSNVSLGSEQLALFRSAILKEIERTVGGPVPKFYGSFVKLGAIVIGCVDGASLRWLSARIGSIAPWPGARLKMIGLNALQKYYRASVWIPGLPVATATVLKLLERQNPGLNTADWRILAENLGAPGEGRSLVLGVPESALEKLGALGFTAHLGLDRVDFVVSTPREG